MELINWEFQGLSIGMIKDDNGDLWCTNQALLSGLKISSSSSTRIYQIHKEEFNLIAKLSNRQISEFARSHKKQLGVSRITKFWSEEEVITFAYHSKSKTAMHFRIELIKFIKEHRKLTQISEDQYRLLVGELSMMKEDINNLRYEREQVVPQFNLAASNAGKTLASFRGTTDFRKIH